MSTHLKTRLLAAGAAMPNSMFNQRPGAPFMLRGMMIPRSPDDGGGSGGGGDGDDPPAGEGETVDKAVHDRIVAAHDALKRDSRRQRQELTDARTRISDLEAELETEKANNDGSTDKATAVQQAVAVVQKKYDTDVAARDKTITALQTELNDTAAEAALERALDEHRVKPELRKAAKALLRGDIEVEEDETQGRVVYMNNLPVADAVKAWAEGDEGKPFILDGNSGGGAPGGRKGGPSANNPWKEGATFNLTEQDRIAASNPTLAGRLKAEAGVA